MYVEEWLLLLFELGQFALGLGHKPLGQPD